MATQGYIKYKADYKYQLSHDYKIATEIKPKETIKTEYIDLDEKGHLLVRKGYAWDGPSGPVIDREENMRASLVHDALYQLMRMKKLSSRSYRKSADQLFKEICKEDGLSSMLASIYYKALRRFGKPASSPQNKKKEYQAPQITK